MHMVQPTHIQHGSHPTYMKVETSTLHNMKYQSQTWWAIVIYKFQTPTHDIMTMMQVYLLIDITTSETFRDVKNIN